MIGRRSSSALRPQRLNIAVTGIYGIPATYGGVERHVEEIYSRLADRGHSVTVYCRNHYTPQDAVYKGIRLKRLPAIPNKHLENPSHTLLSTFDAMLRGYDLVHYHADIAGLFSLLPRLAGAKTVVTLHGLDWQREKWGRFASQVIRFGEVGGVRFPCTTIVVSQTLRQYCRQVYNKEVAYIPNGVTNPIMRPANAIRRLGLERGGYVLFVGRLVPEKGCHYLIEAFKGLETNFKLVIVGGSRHSDEYVRSLTAASTPNIVFSGYQHGETLEELYSNAYLYVQPSTVEGLPITVLEAMSYGLCVIVSDIPENREAIGDCGQTFINRNVNDLRRVLASSLAAPQLVQECGDLARRRVQEHYNWDYIAADTEQLFLQVTGQQAETAVGRFPAADDSRS
jgi:glycosyltransferase involved in cell wall biosynthesis